MRIKKSETGKTTNKSILIFSKKIDTDWTFIWEYREWYGKEAFSVFSIPLFLLLLLFFLLGFYHFLFFSERVLIILRGTLPLSLSIVSSFFYTASRQPNISLLICFEENYSFFFQSCSTDTILFDEENFAVIFRIIGLEMMHELNCCIYVWQELLSNALLIRILN